MQIIDDGKHYLIHSNGVKAFSKLPLENNYSVEFEDGMNGVGFYLAQKPLFKYPNFKVYGDQIGLVDNIINSYNNSDKSIGVILSGPKGTGKTIFSKMLSVKAHEMGMPTIIVNDNTVGVANFLSRIDQSSLVMFDEFEKKFQDNLEVSKDKDSQNDLLSLFDGILGGKNIYVLTVNELIDLSPYILNRPGRFMYAIRMKQPSPTDINSYLEDKLEKAVNNREEQIKEIIQFSFKFPLSFDILDTLVFQLNSGNSFKEALPYLNLMNLGDTDFNIKVTFESGYVYPISEANLDLFSETIKVNIRNISFDFLSDAVKVDNNTLVVDGEDINRVKVDGELKDKVQSGLKPEKVTKLTIAPNRVDGFQFNV